MELKKYLKRRAALVNRELAKLSAGNNLIDKAMRYSLTAGGKRLRPVLVMCAAEICGIGHRKVLDAACALEYVHTYSLIHDDLPSMDNDDLRRGKPTSHRKFGEATAILAGDALLTEAFEILAACGGRNRFKPDNISESVRILAREAGRRGMIAGQMQDTVESGSWRGKTKSSAKKTLKSIHLNKTAALIRASLKIGAVLSGANKETIKRLDKYGKYLGLAFQIADDVLDIEGDKRLLGKKGSDRDNNKLTYPALYGIKKSKQIAQQLTAKAKSEVKCFGGKALVLSQLADYVLTRKY